MTDTLYYTTHDSAIGKLLMVASSRGLRYLTLLGKDEEASEDLGRKFSTPPKPTLMELDAFFGGTARAIDAYLKNGDRLRIPYDLADGTALQRAVWLAIAKIPYGETISYITLAERVGFPRAVRAVASACGANPVPLAIPCHRVVAKDGTLGGFSLGGLEVKDKLLKIEAPRAARKDVAA
ncbi:MAG: methylated-DNA--[protein]-cysteine S-methyltransferase [Rickettsiales bacterium]